MGGKSPLTGGIKEANSGGSAARTLAELGLRGIKVTGQADELSVLVVTADGGKLVPAPELAGLGSFDTVDRLWKQYGDKVSLICTGPAGEMGSRAAAILVTTPTTTCVPPRAAASAPSWDPRTSRRSSSTAPAVPASASPTPRRSRKPQVALTKGIHSHPAMAALEAHGLGLPGQRDASPWAAWPRTNFSAGTWDNAQEHQRRAHGRAPDSASQRRTPSTAA